MTRLEATGALSPAQQRALVREAARARVEATLRSLWRSVPVFSRHRLPSLADRPPPESALTRLAFELAASVSPEPLLRHCVRCWYWSDLLAQVDGVAFDPEALYLACLLHDLGLTDAYRPAPSDPTPCFAMAGARAAQDFVSAHGLAAAGADVVAEAVARHMDARARATSSPEARLLHAAAHLDVAGTRARDLPRPARRRVTERDPRDGFVTCFGQCMAREALERPQSRAAVLWRSGLRYALTHNPLDR